MVRREQYLSALTLEARQIQLNRLENAIRVLLDSSD